MSSTQLIATGPRAPDRTSRHPITTPDRAVPRCPRSPARSPPNVRRSWFGPAPVQQLVAERSGSSGPGATVTDPSAHRRLRLHHRRAGLASEHDTHRRRRRVRRGTRARMLVLQRPHCRRQHAAIGPPPGGRRVLPLCRPARQAQATDRADDPPRAAGAVVATAAVPSRAQPVPGAAGVTRATGVI